MNGSVPAVKPTRLRSHRVTLLYSIAFFVVYIAAAFLCLRRWNSPQPWARLDRFSGGVLVTGVIWLVSSMRFHRAILRSREVMREASGMSYDPALLAGISALAVADFAVFLDYSTWRLTPALALPALQWAGLVLLLVGIAWVYWTDGFLSRHFSTDEAQARVISDGPYRFVRHPRYAGLLSFRIGFALAMGSALGWVIAFLWLALLLHRIRREEPHLRELFGPAYDSYAAHTARLIPHVY